MTFKCKPDCKAECCGIIGFSTEFADKHEHLIKKPIKEVSVKAFMERSSILPDGDSILKLVDTAGVVFYIPPELKCVFLDENFKCMAYDDRPQICRLYGIHSDLLCPYMKPNGNPRSPGDQRRTQRKINRDVDLAMKGKVPHIR